MFTLNHCISLKAIKYESASLNRVVADELCRVIPGKRALSPDWLVLFTTVKPAGNQISLMDPS